MTQHRSIDMNSKIKIYNLSLGLEDKLTWAFSKKVRMLYGHRGCAYVQSSRMTLLIVS